MRAFPFLKAHQKAAEALLVENPVRQCLFSEGTYQLEVVEAKKSFWPFLQLNDEGKLLDCFCTCPQVEKRSSCVHLAVAWCTIFKEKEEPLHVRFRESLWNQLCQMASRRHGYDMQHLKKVEGGFEAVSTTNKQLFFVKSQDRHGERKLEEIFLKRAQETEETSLKFSNLSQDELTLWREGRPSHQLRYELSFWSDLAKWWMEMQEQGKKYQLHFTQEKEGGLPRFLDVTFPHMTAGFYLAEVNWPHIVPALLTVESPLPVHPAAHQRIKAITYNAIEKAFHFEFIESTQQVEVGVQGEAVGEWTYIPHRGFFPARMDPLLKESVITKQRIPQLFHKHLKVVQKYLKDEVIHRGSVSAQYDLRFDTQGMLHIEWYLFDKGDLQKPLSALYDSWAYLEGKGFYEVENLLFEGVTKKVSKSLVSDFVSKHRLWLNHFEGFQIHLSSLEPHLSYSFSPEKGITFEARFEIAEVPGEVLDLGEWLYIQGKGFYAKRTERGEQVLRPGLKIAIEDIPAFIRRHRQELESIQGFFSRQMPLEKTGLEVLRREEHILVKPTYQMKEEYTKKVVHLLGNVTFVDNEGFHEVPEELKLPEGYLKEKVIEPAAEPYFVAYDLDLLQPFLTKISPELRKVKVWTLFLKQLKKDPTSKTGLWLAELCYISEWGEIPVHTVWEGVHTQKRYLFTPAGLLFLHETRLNWLKSIGKKRWVKGGKQLRLSTLELMRLLSFEEVQEPSGKESARLLEELKTFHAPQELKLNLLRSSLRSYQKMGVEWLWFLYCYGLSGLLCDEMGLGKTHQAMALLAAALENDEEKKFKYLVVCPTSVIFHWEGLLQKFLPEMKVCVFYGIQRSLEEFADAHLLLTSYGTLRSEKEKISQLFFEIAIFDEVQSAKNTHSQTHKALKEISAKMYLGLSGTPLENRLLELKALFDLVLPSYLPQEAQFKELFVNPIEKTQDVEKKTLLSKLIRPFILRRKKSDVLMELPEKVETLSYCMLSEEQRTLYRETVKARKEALMKQLSTSQSLPLTHIFSLLSTLKQICDHPALFLEKEEEYHHHLSGKWDLFVELLNEALESNQKVVVFSQYLGMLDIMELYLKEKKIGFAGLRGSTHDRKAQVERFQEDPECSVFVASLQAAGVGIDLVAASVVIHYDRWWNPAKENQATDRVHRIGQNRGVQVFKLIAKDTIEEHIHQLIEKKVALLEGVIGFDEHDQMKGLKKEELLEILRLLEE